MQKPRILRRTMVRGIGRGERGRGLDEKFGSEPCLRLPGAYSAALTWGAGARKAARSSASRSLRAGDVGLLHMAEAAHGERHLGDLHGERMVVRLEAGDQRLHRGLVFADQRALPPPLGGVAEGIERRPAQALECDASNRKAVSIQGPKRRFFKMARRGVAPGDERRRHAEAEPWRTLELRLHLGPEAAVGIEPGDLVLVLVGEQLVIGAGDRLAEPLAARSPRPLGLARPAHQRAVAGGVGRVLIGPEVGRAALDQRVESLWPRRLGHGTRLGRRCGNGLRIVRGSAAPAEGTQVGLDGDAVERDRPLQGLGAQRYLAALVGEAQEEEVGIDGIADQRRRHAGRVDDVERACRRSDHPLQLIGGEVEVGRAGEIARRDRAAVDHGVGGAAVQPGHRLAARRHHQVDAQQQPGAACGDPHRMEVLCLLRDADVAGDGAILLGETRLVEDRGPLALEPCRRAEQRAEGDDPGAADACEQDAVRLGAGGASGLRQRGDRLLGSAGRCARAPAPSLDQHEAGAKTLDAGEILVAGGLVDRPLAPEFGLQRHDREAVRLHAAIAAALAHVRVDDDAPVRVLQQAALAPAPLLGRAHLVVDDGRDTLPLAQLALHLVERVPVMDRHAVRELPVEGVFLRLVGDHGDAADAFRLNLAGDALDRERPVHRLAAGHRHRVVVENLVGHVDAGGDRGAYRQNAGVEIGAVADVLETCGVSVKGACPIQLAPSPPMWVKVAVSRSIHCAM